MIYIAIGMIASGGICLLCAALAETLPERWMKRLQRPLKK